MRKKKILKFIVFVLMVILTMFLLYSYLTINNYKLAEYANSFKKVETRNLNIEFDFSTNTYKIINEENTSFKILQLTDIHLGGSNASYYSDIKALDAMYALIKYAKPDLIILTGDMIFSSILSRNINNKGAAVALKIFMENVGIPWTIAFGNHDYEFYNTANHEEIKKIFSYDKNFLFSSYYYNNEILYSNQKIELYNYDGSSNMNLLIMDSNQLIDVDSSKDAINWYLNAIENQSVSSLLFLHMPFYEYELAWNLFEEKNNDVEYLFGEKRETICYENKSDLFNVIVNNKNTKGIFCGHDHLNDFSIKYKGIQLTYGKSIDYITYENIAQKNSQRGGTLIEIKKDSSFSVKSIPLSDVYY